MNQPPAPTGPSHATLLTLSLGHGAVDLCGGALFAILPFLVVDRHYSYAAAGVFALVATLASAVVQPLMGLHGDRGEAHWLLPAGLLVAGAGVGAVGLTTSYPVTLLAVAVCMAGVAAYHPEGARWARYASGHRVTADMSVFSVGGGAGYALGPLLVAATLTPLGLHGTPVLAVIPLAAAGAVTLVLRRFRGRPAAERHRPHVPTGPSEWRPFVPFVIMFCLLSAVATGLITYVPLFLVHARGTSPAAGNVVTGVFLAAAAAGTLLGGFGAARVGRRFVLVAPQLALVPVIALLPHLGYGWTIAAMAVAGLALNANVGIALVLAQEYLPGHMGLATGLTIGMTGGVGGLIVAALGVLADTAGLAVVLSALAALPLLAAMLAARLPRPAAAPPGTAWTLGAGARRRAGL
jgi:FSR family fosmidomycin resistance protein-like MFS transporter